MRQQRPWRISQKKAPGDLKTPSTVASKGAGARKLLLLRVLLFCNAESFIAAAAAFNSLSLFLFLSLSVCLYRITDENAEGGNIGGEEERNVRAEGGSLFFSCF